MELLLRKERTRLLAICEPVDLVLGEVVCEAGSPTFHVYFPTEGFISLLTLIDDHPSLEVGMVGSEGMVGVQLKLGVLTAPLRAVVQGAGRAWRVNNNAFRTELASSPALQRVLDRYLYVVMSQLTRSAGCLRFHRLGERLARLLLMSQDRAHADTFRVTQEFLAHMLGVRRVGVTNAAGALQKLELIAYRRGELTVLDRAGLEAASCSCYAGDCKVYIDCME